MAGLNHNNISEKNLHILVIAGGSGTRFWPRSRQNRPKQLLNFWDDKSLLEHTVLRFLGQDGKSKLGSDLLRIVTTQALVDASKKALGPVLSNGVQFLGEPFGLKTSPCIYWGLKEISKYDPEAIVCVIPSDHFIGDEEAFRRALLFAAKASVETNGIVTLGVKPTRPETGYGYIEIDSSGVENASQSYQRVVRFVEKPVLRDALKFLSTNRYLWNAGFFVFPASVGLEAFRRCMPSLVKAFESSENITEVYRVIDPHDAVSVDYGVLEMAQEKGISVSVIPVDFTWNDLGSFTALEDIDKAVKGRVLTHNAASNIVQSDTGLIALLGVHDLVVVREGDVVLVASKDHCQDIRKLVEKVKKEFPESV